MADQGMASDLRQVPTSNEGLLTGSMVAGVLVDVGDQRIKATPAEQLRCIVLGFGEKISATPQPEAHTSNGLWRPEICRHAEFI